MNNSLQSFIAGALVGAGLVMALISLPDTTHLKAIAECEKELPRNQQCIIKAVPN